MGPFYCSLRRERSQNIYKMALNSVTRKAVLSAVKVPRIQQVANMGAVSKIGNREVVGFGFNGERNYVDRVDFPMPAIRFKENTPDIQALHEKATGDWKKLSIEEKKALYRASFAQTFSEMKAPTGEWKGVLGLTLIISSLSVWIYMENLSLYFSRFTLRNLRSSYSRIQLEKLFMFN